jgi:hypothetical protein
MDKNNLRFLQFRDTLLNVSSLEERAGIQLPPIYKSFITTFKPYFAHHRIKMNEDEFSSFIVPIYCSFELDEYSIDDDELSLESFKEVDELFSFERSNKDYLEGYIFIANHGFSGGLLLGISSDNSDKIYLNTDSKEITYLCDNIFQLLHKIRLVEFSFDDIIIDKTQLYSNWGEEFWRLRSS